MTQPQALRHTYHGETAICLQAGAYEAVVLPRIGANLISFRDKAHGYNFLHEPSAEEMEDFKASPVIHGIPFLFPPNRYEDGKFAWDGKTYNFPVNEKPTNNHIHGFLHTIPWEVEQFGADELESRVTLSVTINERHEVYRHFPHRFTVKLTYTLSEAGLQQQLFIRNEGRDRMPCLFAFHTAINAPFVKGGQASDYTFRATIGDRYELSERMLPTGKLQELGEQEENIKQSGVYPFFEAMDNHYTVQTQNGRNFAEITDHKHNVTLVYDVGTSYKHWMIWNNFATEGFFCPEPQINMVNAPNVEGIDAEEIGLFGLEPGEIFEESARLYVK